MAIQDAPAETWKLTGSALGGLGVEPLNSTEDWLFCHDPVEENCGLEHNPRRPEEGELRPHSPISGLRLSGQEISTVGIVGTLPGAILDTPAITGRNLMKD